MNIWILSKHVIQITQRQLKFEHRAFVVVMTKQLRATGEARQKPKNALIFFFLIWKR